MAIGPYMFCTGNEKPTNEKVSMPMSADNVIDRRGLGTIEQNNTPIAMQPMINSSIARHSAGRLPHGKCCQQNSSDSMN